MIGFGTMIHLGEAVVGLCTGDPVLVVDGLTGAGRSYLVGELMSPITEPIKEAVKDAYSDVDWIEVMDTCPTW